MDNRPNYGAFRPPNPPPRGINPNIAGANPEGVYEIVFTDTNEILYVHSDMPIRVRCRYCGHIGISKVKTSCNWDDTCFLLFMLLFFFIFYCCIPAVCARTRESAHHCERCDREILKVSIGHE
ncbi:unnamed protein product [Moneuplotes crassus]|uniref:LITAF domain-containing protein n=1 Tax=Euplotes crassus TaxID=5936 RepID=A0AAD1U713_EUPCR|nr:unnamed protein product [Moneuplotes crassus]